MVHAMRLVYCITVRVYMQHQFPKINLLSKMVAPLPQVLPSADAAVILSGFPYDEGTRRNNGRVGGAVAPMKFRQCLQKSELYCSDFIPIYDSGNIPQDELLEHAHVTLQQKHYHLLGLSSSVLFVIGGSNDQSYPNAKALLRKYSKIAVINVDAHFDVRPLKDNKAHSGSPFRLLLDDHMFSGSKFVQFACKGASTAKAHYEYLMQKKVPVYWMEGVIRRYQTTQQSKYRTQGGQCFEKIIEDVSKDVEAIFVSFDSDAISSRWMPGVSAPSVVGGLTADQAYQIMAISGSCDKVKLVDCSQFNPAVEWFFSAQLLVQMFHSFIEGVSKRKKSY